MREKNTKCNYVALNPNFILIYWLFEDRNLCISNFNYIYFSYKLLFILISPEEREVSVVASKSFQFVVFDILPVSQLG